MMLSTTLVTCLALALPAGAQNTPELLLATDIDVRPALEQAIEEFSRKADCLIRPVWVNLEAPSTKARTADILLWQEGDGRSAEFRQLLEPGTNRLIGQKRLAILTRQGNPIAIETLSDLGKKGVKVALAGTEWKLLHRETNAALRRAEVTEAIHGNVTRRFANADLLVRALRKGKIDVALGWDVLEGLAPSEIDAIVLPDQLATAVSIHVAVARRTEHKQEARSFVDFLASVVGQAVLGRYGYQVPLHSGGADAYDDLVERRLKSTFPLTAMRMINESGITEGICLDIGCGTGQLDVALAKISDLKIVGVDIDPEMIKIARKRIEDAGLSDRVSFVVGDVHNMPFDKNYADLIVSRGSLLFWKDKVRALKEIHRVLEPTGSALLGGRYLFTPARFKMSDDELRQTVEETKIPNIKVDTFRGQWVKILGARAPKAARQSRRGPHMLANRFIADYGITEGKCLLVCTSAQSLQSLQQGFVSLTRLEITALLPSPKELAKAEEKIRGAKLTGRITCKVGKIGVFPFEEADFDLIAGVGPMLIFAKDKKIAMRDVYRVLRPGGVALIGGRYLGMPDFRKVSTESLLETAAETGLPRVRVIEETGQWVEIRKPRGAARTDRKKPGAEMPKETAGEKFFKLYPVGKVEQLADGSARIRISDHQANALLGLDNWSHVNVLWWFDRNDNPRRRGILRVHPRGNRENPLTGVFACRAPVRPNLIALTVCKILSVKGNVLHVDKIDAFDGTSVLDLKPLIPSDVPHQEIKVPDWRGSK